jgi:hypothetical protein
MFWTSLTKYVNRTVLSQLRAVEFPQIGIIGPLVENQIPDAKLTLDTLGQIGEVDKTMFAAKYPFLDNDSIQVSSNDEFIKVYEYRNQLPFENISAINLISIAKSIGTDHNTAEQMYYELVS